MLLYFNCFIASPSFYVFNLAFRSIHSGKELPPVSPSSLPVTGNPISSLSGTNVPIVSNLVRGESVPCYVDTPGSEDSPVPLHTPTYDSTRVKFFPATSSDGGSFDSVVSGPNSKTAPAVASEGSFYTNIEVMPSTSSGIRGRGVLPCYTPTLGSEGSFAVDEVSRASSKRIKLGFVDSKVTPLPTGQVGGESAVAFDFIPVTGSVLDTPTNLTGVPITEVVLLQPVKLLVDPDSRLTLEVFTRIISRLGHNGMSYGDSRSIFVTSAQHIEGYSNFLLYTSMSTLFVVPVSVALTLRGGEFNIDNYLDIIRILINAQYT